MAESNVSLKGASYCEGEGLNVVLKVKDYVNQKDVEVSVPRSQLSPKSIKNAIIENGGVCQDAKAIYKSISKQFDAGLQMGSLYIQRFHQSLGWKFKEETIVFEAEKTISEKDLENSLYLGTVDVKQIGSIEMIKKMIEKEIIGLEEWSPLEVILAFGVGATILGYANHVWNESLNNVLLHLLGSSSSGKSTALTLFAGLGANPNPKKGFWINYSASEVSIVKRIGNNNGFPVVIDEFSSGTAKEYSSLVYSIGNGEEKDRLMAGGSQFQDSATFETIVLSSGEKSILKKCSKDGGIRARCVELSNISWTNSKAQSNNIKSCMRQNYGVVTPKIAQELLNNNNEWQSRWEYWKLQVANKFEKDDVKLSISERIADYVALFALAAEVFNKVVGVELDVSKIFKFCYENIIIANEEEGNLALRAYAAIVEYITSNKDRFGDATFYSGCRSQHDDITLETYHDGFFHAVRKKNINGKAYEKVFVFRPGRLENILSDAGFSDGKVSLYKLREEGFLLTKDKKRNTKPYTLNGATQNCIAVYFCDETMQGCEIED